MSKQYPATCSVHIGAMLGIVNEIDTQVSEMECVMRDMRTLSSRVTRIARDTVVLPAPAPEPIPEPLHGNTLHSSRDVLWAALDRARDLYTDPEWDRICTAMAWIAEACEMELDAESEDE